MAKTIGDRLREVRERNGWTQAQVGEWTGIAPVQVAHYEAGRREPNAANLAALASGLRVSADWLLGLE